MIFSSFNISLLVREILFPVPEPSFWPAYNVFVTRFNSFGLDQSISSPITSPPFHFFSNKAGRYWARGLKFFKICFLKIPKSKKTSSLFFEQHFKSEKHYIFLVYILIKFRHFIQIKPRFGI